MKARCLVLLLSLIAAFASAARADGLIIIHNPPGRNPAFPHHPLFAPLEVVYHKVDVEIDGQKATTHVDQEFSNPNNASLEGDYIFPIPKGAQIDKFTMRLGDKDMEAELLDATKARTIYEDIVRRQRDPALLEYTGRGAFRVRIFPIEPHSRKRVQLSYTELLRSDSGVVSYLYPLNTEKFSAQPLRTAAIKISLNAHSPIKALYSPTHSVDIRRKGDRAATIGWETNNARPDRDFQILFSTNDTEYGVSLLTHRPSSAEGSFLLLAAPGAEMTSAMDHAKPQAKDVVFVVDTSGSMAGAKLQQAKKALAFCVENLNDVDHFEVLRFSTETESCFENLTAATDDSRTRAQAWIKNLKATGGTAIHDALRQALRLRPRASGRPFVIIFLTDGQPTVGETNEDRIVSAVTTSDDTPTRIFCFGIGTDVNTHLLDKIVERTRAASQYVLPEEDLEVKVSSFFTKIKEPLLTNLKISWPDGVRVTKAYPQPLPDLFRGDQLVLAGRYQGSGEGDVVIEGLVNGKPQRIRQHVTFPKRGSDNEFIPRLWATRRVGWLLDEIRLRGENAELRDEVVELARKYGIVTPYTSYLIVEDEARRGVPVAQRSMQNLDRDTAAQGMLRQGYDSFRVDKAGDASALNARANANLKAANNTEAITLSAFEVSRATEKAARSPGNVSGSMALAAPAATAAATKDRIDATQQASRTINGKTFFQNGSQWLDSDVQRLKSAKTVRLQFGSAEYFKLLQENPHAAQWLALGQNVQFTLGDMLYDVFE